MLEGACRVTEVVARLQGANVAFHDGGLLGELLVDPVDGHFQRPVEHPEGQAQGKEVLRTVLVLGRQPLDVLQRLTVQRSQRDLDDLVLLERAVFEWVDLIARLAQIALGEGVGVDDDRAVGLHIGQARLEGGRVHGHQHLGRVAGGQNVAVGKVDLEAADAGQRARRGADLGREVGHGADVVAENGRRVGELRAG